MKIEMTDKIMEARRAKFETYWENTRRNIPARDGNGYATPVADCCWEFFNIALDSLCVELPNIQVYGTVEGAYEACKESIRAAGVKTK